MKTGRDLFSNFDQSNFARTGIKNIYLPFYAFMHTVYTYLHGVPANQLASITNGC